MPFVSISELDYLRRTWACAVFALLTRYQQDLELKRKECKERFGCTQSGNCTYCGKYIQMDLGKHIAFYHLELAQLWRCPVMWCTVWKGTAQDCIDHMRRIHKIPLSVKAANLAKYFPAWTISRVEWSKMLMPCVSGVAIDTLLFSRVSSSLCHHYRLISRTGSHPAFRGTYLRRLWSFIEDRDAAGGRQGPRGLDRRVSARMVKSTERSVSRGRRPRRLKGSVSANKGCRLSERPSAEMSSVQALMELALPRFTMSEGIRGKHSPWPVAKEAPASPSPNRNELTVKVPRCSSTQQVAHSVYFDLDALASSPEDELVDAKKCQDLSVTVLCKPEEYDTRAKSKISASDFVNRLESDAGDVRKVVRNRNEPTDSQKGLPMRPRSRHELSAPTVDLIT